MMSTWGHCVTQMLQADHQDNVKVASEAFMSMPAVCDMMSQKGVSAVNRAFHEAQS